MIEYGFFFFPFFSFCLFHNFHIFLSPLPRIGLSRCRPSKTFLSALFSAPMGFIHLTFFDWYNGTGLHF